MKSPIRNTTLPIRFFLACLSSVLCANAQTDGTVPPDIAAKYASMTDKTASDEFNGASLDARKWGYRTEGEGWATGPEYVKMIEEGATRYVSIQGKWGARKGSGISAKNPTYFGFFAVRWRTDGIIWNKNTPWHPAVWMAAQNFSTGADRRIIPDADKNLEIDLIEIWNDPVWHCQTIAWDRSKPMPPNKVPTQILRERKNDFPSHSNGWQEHGLEYTPEYLQLWQKVGGKWKAIGERVEIRKGENSKSAVNKEHATPGYWILSNKDHF